MGPVNLSSIHAWLLIGQLLYGPGAGILSCCDFIIVMSVSCPDGILQLSPLSFGFYFGDVS